jgi:hypothetical protein
MERCHVQNLFCTIPLLTIFYLERDSVKLMLLHTVETYHYRYSTIQKLLRKFTGRTETVETRKKDYRVAKKMIEADGMSWN